MSKNSFDQFSLIINPAFKLLIFVFVELILFQLLNYNEIFSIGISLASILIFLVLYFLGIKKTAYIIGTIAISSMLNYQIQSVNIDFSKKFHIQEDAIFNGEIEKIISQNNKGQSCLIDGSFDMKNYDKINSKAIIFIYGKKHFYPGDKIKGNIKINPPAPRQTNYDFLEKSYLLSKKANFRCFAFSNNISIKSFNNTLDKWVYLKKEAFIQHINTIFEPDNAGIVTAFLTGEKSYLNRNTKREFSLTGTAHLLAVSGFHIGFLSFLLWAFLKLIKNPRVIILTFIILIGSFVIFTGSSPSAVRAGLMGVLIIYCYAKQWHFELMNIFALAILISLIVDPFKIFSVSFQLSVSAVFGIIGFYPIISKRIFRKEKINNSILKKFIDALSVSIAASIFVGPVSAYYFNNYPVYSVLANIIAIPLTSLSMAFAIASIFFSLISDYIATALSFVSEFLLEIIKLSNSMILSFDYSVISGVQSFYLSLFIVLVFISFIFSSKALHFVFAFIISLSFYFLLFQSSTTDRNIYNRQYYKAVKKESIDKTEFVVSEYNFLNTPRPDYQFENYLLMEYDSLTIACYDPAYLFSESFYTNDKIEIKYLNKLESDININN